MVMKAFLIPAAFAAAIGLSMGPAPASAKGCIKGAVVGGVAGHFAGHHGVLGAGAGCVIGHHEAKKHQRQEERAHRQDWDDHGGSGSSDRGYGR
jgi:hypothetical protein